MIARLFSTKRSRAGAALAVGALALLAVGIPTAVTGANFTAQAQASAAIGMGQWCSTPNPTTKKNVHPLSTLPSVAGTRMIIVPVVPAGEYLATDTPAESGRLGIRVWGCGDVTNSALKVTAWRGSGAPTAGDWITAPANGSYASARLNPAGTLGTELRNLHSGSSVPGGVDPSTGVNASTSRYSWLLDSTRDRGAKSAANPACGNKSCVVAPSKTGASFSSALSLNEAAPASGAVVGNSVTYLASKYYAEGGTWPVNANGSAAAPAASPTKVASPGFANPLADTSGRLLQWVVIEWTGATPPPSVEVEVFVG